MIQMLDLENEFLDIKDEVIETVVDILKSTKYILGPNVAEFEKEVAFYHGVSHAAGVSSGTDALHLSLASLGISEGDEVITSPFTFFATVESIIYVGAKPVFVDIDPETMNIDPKGISEKITDKTKAILNVHLFGLPCDMEAILDIANKAGLYVVEDCAQAFGASISDKKVGSFGTMGCFSFYPSKNLGCYGDGGIVTVNDRKFNDELKRLRNHGSAGNYVHEKIGFNSRLDEIQAGILLIKLKKIDEMNKSRKKNALLYDSLLKGYVECPPVIDNFECVYHQYTIRSPHRDHIKQALLNEDISSVIYYPKPMHLQPALSNYEYRAGDLPISEKTSSEVLSLPVYPTLSEKEIHKICDVIKRCLAQL